MRFGGSPFSGERSPNRAGPLPATNPPSALPTSPEVGGILEEDVEFDDATGHDHTGTGGTGTPIPLAGDVTGDNTAAAVVQLQGYPLDATPPSLGDVLTSDGSQWTPQPPVSAAGTPCQLGDWYVEDISTFSTSATELKTPGAIAGGGVQLGQVMLADGHCLGIGVLLAGDVGGVGTAFTVELYVNGVASGQQAVVTGAAGTERSAVDLSLSVAFIRTDILSVWALRTGAASAVAARAFLLVQF